MSLTSTQVDPARLLLTLTVDLNATPEQAWQLWADPRKLARWLIPAPFTGSVQRHELTTAGDIVYSMTAPGGQSGLALLRVIHATAPTSLSYIDGLANADGSRLDGFPTATIAVQLTARGGGTRMEVRSIFYNRQHMDDFINVYGTVHAWEMVLKGMDAALIA
ncbi:SRPBCC family protein [Rhizohabitans arisaemae]|uniref:SRPBCC family protein n=1 Tax=Rhizohabitans arisaemae TaxID=2720610 RepID=UPI0024B124B5|nr:SRPBCC domain-containing protein [Rhizohabitans arisaemae]